MAPNKSITFSFQNIAILLQMFFSFFFFKCAVAFSVSGKIQAKSFYEFLIKNLKIFVSLF